MGVRYKDKSVQVQNPSRSRPNSVKGRESHDKEKQMKWRGNSGERLPLIRPWNLRLRLGFDVCLEASMLLLMDALK